jgi:hypothetical protein
MPRRTLPIACCPQREGSRCGRGRSGWTDSDARSGTATQAGRDYKKITKLLYIFAAEKIIVRLLQTVFKSCSGWRSVLRCCILALVQPLQRVSVPLVPAVVGWQSTN